MTELHVIADERSTWRVYATDAAQALSEHTSATNAESRAGGAEDRGVERVVVHDRYHRTHDTAVSPSGVSAREQAARTRQVARSFANALASCPRKCGDRCPGPASRPGSS